MTAPAPAPRPAPPPPGGAVKAAPPPRAGTSAISLRTGPAENIAPRIVLNAVEGWGKTTAGAYAPRPLFLMAKGETGYEDLLGRGSVPQAPRAVCDTWQGTLDLCDALAEDPDDFDTVVADAAGGFERLCHQHVCDRDFNGDWGEKGFQAFMRGYDISVADWLLFLQRLDRLHNLGKTILLLSHCQVRNFKNPLGSDFDRYTSDLHEKTWRVTHRWASAVLFGTFVSVTVEDKKKRGKTLGIGGEERVLYTSHTDAWDAKNRYGMPPQVAIPEDHTAVWNAIWTAINGEER